QRKKDTYSETLTRCIYRSFALCEQEEKYRNLVPAYVEHLHNEPPIHALSVQQSVVWWCNPRRTCGPPIKITRNRAEDWSTCKYHGGFRVSFLRYRSTRNAGQRN